MKLDTFVPFGRPQAGSDIIRLNTELDSTDNFKFGTAIPKPSRKQSNELIFSTKNRMSQCTYFENI